MKEQIESIAIKYALLMEERLDKALADGEKDLSYMEQVDEGIKMLGYLVNAVRKAGCSNSGNYLSTPGD